MRCLNCYKDGIPKNETVCPRCHAYLTLLLQGVLPRGMMLHNNTYRINYALDRGGFGIIYRAVHTGLDCLVAIKEFYPREYGTRGNDGSLQIPFKNRRAFDAEYKQFLLEGHILSGLNHRGIIEVRDLFEENGTVYLVMELLEGQPLRRELEQQTRGKLTPERVRKIIRQLVITLEFLHRRGVYHLDIKPENVFFTSTERVVLIDFGAARLGVDGYVTRQFDPEYAAPELLNGGEVGPQSDLYELGVMAYELLTGSRPPSALARVYDNEWNTVGLDEPWKSCLAPALQLTKEKRPESVLKWWIQTMGAGLPPLFREHSDIFLDPEEAQEKLEVTLSERHVSYNEMYRKYSYNLKMLEEKEREVKEKNRKLTDLETREKKLQTRLQNEQAKKQELGEDLCDVVSEVTALGKEEKILLGKLQEENKKTSELNRKLARANQRTALYEEAQQNVTINTILKDLNSDNATIISLQEQIGRMNGRIKRIEKEKVDLLEEVGMLKYEMTILQNQIQGADNLGSFPR